MRIKITESQYGRLETLISEIAAGSDDFGIRARHTGKGMGILHEKIEDLVHLFKGVERLLTFDDIEYIDLRENLIEVIDIIDEINDVFRIVLIDFTEKRLAKTLKGLKRGLTKLQEKIRQVIILGPEIISKEKVLSELRRVTLITIEKLAEFIDEHKSTHENLRDLFKKRGPKPKEDFN
jgi:hypothetical protein